MPIFSNDKELEKRLHDANARVSELEEELAACKAENEGLKKRAAISTSNFSLLEDMVEKREATIRKLEEQVRHLSDGLPPAVVAAQEAEATAAQELQELQEVVATLRQQVDERNALYELVREEAAKAEEAKEMLAQQLEDEGRARRSLQAILERQMQGPSGDPQRTGSSDSLSALEGQVMSAAQRVSDFVARSWQDSQNRIARPPNGTICPAAAPAPPTTPSMLQEKFELQTLSLGDVCSGSMPRPLDDFEADLPQDEEASNLGLVACNSAAAAADADESQNIVVRTRKKKRKGPPSEKTAGTAMPSPQAIQTVDEPAVACLEPATTAINAAQPLSELAQVPPEPVATVPGVCPTDAAALSTELATVQLEAVATAPAASPADTAAVLSSELAQVQLEAATPAPASGATQASPPPAIPAVMAEAEPVVPDQGTQQLCPEHIGGQSPLVDDNSASTSANLPNAAGGAQAYDALGDIADWLMEPLPSKATEADKDLQEQLRTLQAQLADMQKMMCGAQQEAEQALTRNKILCKTIDDLAIKLQEALHEREEMRERLQSYEDFWGPEGPPTGLEPGEDEAEEASDSSSSG